MEVLLGAGVFALMRLYPQCHLLSDWLALPRRDSCLGCASVRRGPERRPGCSLVSEVSYCPGPGPIARSVHVAYSPIHGQHQVGPLPTVFRIAPYQVHKLLIVVELLLGEIPDRLQFRQPSLKRSLMPYFLLTQGKTLPLPSCLSLPNTVPWDRQAH